MSPTQVALDAVTQVREKNRASKLFNHLAAVGEGISALGWVTMEGVEAAKYVGEMRDASQFYGNRVIREYKDTYLPPSMFLTVGILHIRNGRLPSSTCLMSCRNM